MGAMVPFFCSYISEHFKHLNKYHNREAKVELHFPKQSSAFSLITANSFRHKTAPAYGLPSNLFLFLLALKNTINEKADPQQHKNKVQLNLNYYAKLTEDQHGIFERKSNRNFEETIRIDLS